MDNDYRELRLLLKKKYHFWARLEQLAKIGLVMALLMLWSILIKECLGGDIIFIFIFSLLGGGIGFAMGRLYKKIEDDDLQ